MKFLIVDDDSTARELLRVFLSPYAHCAQAFNGQEAIEAIRLAIEDGQPYDLVCLDIMMPGMDGHETLDRIRQIEAQHGLLGSDGTKVIMTTALRDPKHCIRSFHEGCESYCTKPLKQEQLLREVRALIGGLPAPTSDEVSPEAEAGPSDRNRYLIVDDDRVCRELVSAILSPYGQCSFAHDGQEAFDAVRLALEDGVPYGLICLDIMMPGMDGHEALRRIRQLEADHGIYGSDGVKVLMTTALRDSKHCVQSFREGCECYITKPIDADELLSKARQLNVLDTVSSR
ncbi:MAG: response regulator [Pirellulales bacterium]|nr:response regulator [Pirellulales bacterium]